MHQPVDILDTKLLSDRKYALKEISFRVNEGPGAGEERQREVYERGSAACVLLYNARENTVILTWQLRLPTYLNGNPSGMMIECCAGVMDEGENPEACIRREALEETGYRLDTVEKIFDAYMSPASLTERIYFFAAPYTQQQKVAAGGGLEAEQEHIEVLELPFDKAYDLIATGEIRDAKTIMLLQYVKLQGIL